MRRALSSGLLGGTAEAIRRLVGTVFAAAVASTTLVGLATAHAQTAASAAPMAKCIPGTGNQMNPCPWP